MRNHTDGEWIADRLDQRRVLRPYRGWVLVFVSWIEKKFAMPHLEAIARRFHDAAFAQDRNLQTARQGFRYGSPFFQCGIHWISKRTAENFLPVRFFSISGQTRW